MDYENKLVLAPMVRVGTLPFRLLAAQYGADITYGEEIIDHKMIKCERRLNEHLGSTDFVEKGTNNVVFRTCSLERKRVVFQMGTSNAARALSAAQILCQDVAAIDINMGCPKSFSISGGMGAALLNKPDLIHDSCSITCRRVADRPRDPAKWSEIADVVAALTIPVIANGDIFEFDDFQRIKVHTGASSMMVARGALWNASIFSPEGKLPWEDVKREYVRKSILWDNDIKGTKHTLKEMIMHYSCLELPEGKALIKSESLADIAKLYGEENYYQFVQENRLFNGSR
ncbi:tRNA-dihydrouridine(20) synthase [NAD(P)+]-like isoform X2 [Benincasa hispida]|uniref:tRNA-dihydrouridine(20) synthase [NAD(P)+]-like isoform X2 n=1 Tax=Benincasa hispida TaxID=102211 RepID=UPI001900CCAB|nr:tRNA-dihydrouridine(20) synthase [NAD(P)+]-like isoform X2 [Benincasa hispida]